MVKKPRPNRETWLSTESFSPVCEARRKEHSAATSGVPSFHCPPRVSPSGSASAAPTLAVLACVAAGLGASLLPDCVGFIGMTGVRMCDIERPNGLPKVGLALIRRIHPRRKLADRFWQACLDQAPVAG
jgi:DNA-binding transcriptional LysR family regulator